jgi:fatty acid desaturase
MQVQTVHNELEQVAHSDELILNALDELSNIDGLRNSFTIIFQWGVILISAGVSILLNAWWAYTISIFIIASRQHALGVLFHEASHYRLYRQRWINDLISDLFCALPSGIITSRYRFEHLRHHAAPNTNSDPYWRVFQRNPFCWRWPKKPSQAALVLIRDVLGINTPRALLEFWPWFPWANHFGSSPLPPPLSIRDRFITYFFFSAVLFSLFYLNAWLEFLLLWVLPLSTVTQLLLRIRAISEHFGLEAASGPDATRHIDASWFEGLAISPLNINYHLAHHMFPNVTWYNLPKLNQMLFSNQEFSANAHRTPSYLGSHGVLRHELTIAESLP